jgi:hypothetical protein
VNAAFRSVAVVLSACACLVACAGSVISESPIPERRNEDALLVLPGFGYDRGAQKNFRSLGRSLAEERIDVYVPVYIKRSGLAASQEELLEFYRNHHLDRYARLHVFAFIAGAWTLNPLLENGRLPNVATVMYDRSPLQERAPRIAAEKLHFLTWLRYGQPVFDLARTPYTPLTATNVRIGLMVETRPTSLVRRYERLARGYGPFHFECDAFGQRYDDCVYLPMNHDELYVRFQELRPELVAFIHGGRFTPAANREPPAGDPFAPIPPQ